MSGRFLYEAELRDNELGGYSVTYPDLPDAFTFGKDLQESVERAAEVLELVIGEHLDDEKTLPDPIIRGHSEEVLCVLVSVEVTPEMIERMKCVTTTEAASMLGLSTGRISHMLDAGVLQAVPFGNERLVTLASINERKANPRKAGRPKKEKGGKLMEKKEYRIRDANAHRDKNAPKRIADDIELQVWIEERDWQGKVLCFAIPNQHGEFSSREDVELTTRRVAAHYDVPVECVTEI